MTREQAINYLISSGFNENQVGEIVRALTYIPRDCANCKHYVVTDTRTNWGSQETTKIYGCECWECEYEPTIKNNLGVEEVTALAEWIEKLTKAREDAYNKGYADGMKAQEPRKGHWINTANPRMSDNIVCSECGYDSIANFKFCPCCGADMRGVEE